MELLVRVAQYGANLALKCPWLGQYRTLNVLHQFVVQIRIATVAHVDCSQVDIVRGDVLRAQVGNVACVRVYPTL